MVRLSKVDKFITLTLYGECDYLISYRVKFVTHM